MNDDCESELVLPFVAVASAGGPFDDESFCAGYECGLLDAQLAEHPPILERTIRTANTAQADLIAMRHGYTLHLAEDVDEWTHASFVESVPA